MGDEYLRALGHVVAGPANIHRGLGAFLGSLTTCTPLRDVRGYASRIFAWPESVYRLNPTTSGGLHTATNRRGVTECTVVE